MTTATLRYLTLACAGSALACLLVACGDGSDDAAGKPAAGPIVFAPEGEILNAYDPQDGFKKQSVICCNEDESDPDVPAINGQTCFDPTQRGRFVAADDYTQPNPPPHWSIFQLDGTQVGELDYRKLGELRPTFQGGVGNADPVGCAFLSDGRLITSDIGNNQSGPTNGQVILWFTPITDSTPRYCKLDITVGTAGGLYVDEQNRVYVASTRGASGIYRYSNLPTSDSAAGGCGGRDEKGSPLADAVVKERFIPGDSNIATPTSVTGSRHGTFYVSSVLNGVIAEYGADGAFIRRVLQPPAGERFGMTPFSTGSPFNVTTDRAGTLYYADLGLVLGPGGIGPGRRLGTVRRLRFADGVPQPPETIDSGLRFPDGVGIFE